MKKEIKIILNKYSWDYFFNEIQKSFKYDFQKVHVKLSELYEWKKWNDHMKIWTILKIKKIKFEYFWEIIFWVENDKNLSIENSKIIKIIIENFLNDCKNDSFFEENKNKIIIDYNKFIETWCWVIYFNITNSNDKLINLFSKLLTKIYNFLYLELIWKTIDEIIINDIDFIDYEKKLEIPYWLKWTGLENDNNNNNIEVQKIEKLRLEDMWWNKNLKLEIWKLISFYRNKEHFKKWNIEPPRWIILFGPPWTWKTLTAKIIASEINLNFYTLSSTDIMSMWLWESAKKLKDFFKWLKCPCIVFMDEIDAIIPKRDGDKPSNSGSNETVQVINTLLQEIDGFWEKKDILFIWATNRIDAIDPAILRAGRLDYKIFVDYPDLEARKEIWWIYLKKAKQKTNYNFLDNNVNFDILARDSSGFTGSDIAEIVRRLLNDYAIWSLISNKVTNIIWWETTLKWLLHIISKYKNEKSINSNALPAKQNIKLSDIWWSKDLKNELLKIINQYKNKEYFEELWISMPRWILLYWPPWTWKTLAAKALAWEIWEIFYSVKWSDFLSQWVNGSVIEFKKIFDSFESPCVVFIDEIDIIAKNRDKANLLPEEDIKLLNTFLQYVDWFDDKKEILFIWATNRIDALDKAILRAWRFDIKILVDYPDCYAREEIWKIYIEKSITKSNKQSIFSNDIDYQVLIEKSEKMTWADIAEVIREVKEIFAIKEAEKNNVKKDIKIKTTIKMKELLNTLNEYKEKNQITAKNSIGFNL